MVARDPLASRAAGGCSRVHGQCTWWAKKSTDCSPRAAAEGWASGAFRPTQLASVFSCLAFGQLHQSTVPFHPRDPLLSWLFTSTSPGRPASNTTNPRRSPVSSGMFSISSSPAPSIPRFRAISARSLDSWRQLAVTDRLDATPIHLRHWRCPDSVCSLNNLGIPGNVNTIKNLYFSCNIYIQCLVTKRQHSLPSRLALPSNRPLNTGKINGKGISIQRPQIYPTPRTMKSSHHLRNVSPAPNDHHYLRQHLTYKVTRTPTTVATPATIPTIASTLSAPLGPGASLTLSEMLTLDVPPPVTLTFMLFLLLLSPEEPVVGEHQHTYTAGWEAELSYLTPHRPSPSPRTQSSSASGTSCM